MAAAAAAGKVLAVGGQAANTTIRNVTAGKGGTALAIFGVLMVGWLFLTGRLSAVGRVITEGPSALDQLLQRKPTGGAKAGGAMTPLPLATAPISGVFPGGKLPGTPPIAPVPAQRRIVRISIPNLRNKSLPNIDIEVLAGPQCLKQIRTLAIAQGYTRMEAEQVALQACAQTVSPIPIGG